MLAIMTMLPPLPKRIICLAVAWAVMKAPVTLTSNMRFASSALYSSAGVSCWMPAAAMSPSSRPCASPMSAMTLFSPPTSRTSICR